MNDHYDYLLASVTSTFTSPIFFFHANFHAKPSTIPQLKAVVEAFFESLSSDFVKKEVISSSYCKSPINLLV